MFHIGDVFKDKFSTYEILAISPTKDHADRQVYFIKEDNLGTIHYEAVFENDLLFLEKIG